MIYARQSLVTHAKAFGLNAIDLVDIDYKGTRDQSTVINIYKGIYKESCVFILKCAVALARGFYLCVKSIIKMMYSA